MSRPIGLVSQLQVERMWMIMIQLTSGEVAAVVGKSIYQFIIEEWSTDDK